MVKLISRRNLRANIHFFCEHSSIHGLNFLTMKNITPFERIIWAIINAGLVFTTIYYMTHLWLDYAEEATVVTLESSNYHIKNIMYPAVSICSLNKISKERANAFAKNISSVKPAVGGDNIPRIVEDIKLLGNLYDSENFGQDRFTHFHKLLTEHAKDENYDPTQYLIMLAPWCQEILLHCIWGGTTYPCEELFLTRMTYDGPCCVFNYLRPMQIKWPSGVNPREPPEKAEVPHGSGIKKGLEVILRNNLDDYFHTTMETVGFMLHIFDPNDYPDAQSGSLTEILVGAGTYALISMDIDVIQSSPAMETLPIKLRKCKFENDDTTIFGPYRQSDCFVECKIKSMMALCDCVPFTLPVLATLIDTVRVCTLTDVPCLNKHKVTWTRYYPLDDEERTGLNEELYDSLECEKCLPDCNSVKYQTYANFAPFSPSISSSRPDNVTEINIFVSKAFGNLYKVDLTYTWFEVLSSSGGVLSLLMGFSVISLMEIFLFLCRTAFYYIYTIKNKFHAFH